MSNAGEFNIGTADRAYDPPRQANEGGTGDAQETLRDMGERLRETAEDTLRRVQEAAPEYYEQGRKKLSELTAGIEAYIRREPVKATLIAAGIGLCVGVCLARR